MADERGSQAGGRWPVCGGCGKPQVPRGLGTALKPAHEPVVVARKPLSGTVAQTVLEHGTGALNIDGCRIGAGEVVPGGGNGVAHRGGIMGEQVADGRARVEPHDAGRWPANVVLSHTEECVPVGTRKVGTGERKTTVSQGPKFDSAKGWNENAMERRSTRIGTETVTAWQCHPECPVRLLDEQTGERPGCSSPSDARPESKYRPGQGSYQPQGPIYGDSGGASRFFYCAKTSSAERNAGLDAFEKGERVFMGSGGRTQVDGEWVETHSAPIARANVHPTVKPIELMRWLVRLVTPTGGTVLDPFTGSGTTGCAAVLEGFDFIGIERDPEYIEIANARITWWAQHPEGMKLVQRLEAEAEQKAIADAGQLGLFG